MKFGGGGHHRSGDLLGMGMFFGITRQEVNP